MNHDREYGRILSFRQSGEELRRKAETAIRVGDILKALKQYRTALEQDPDDLASGLAYAALLWECDCWRSSLRESYRLLSRFPHEEKVYGLIYRNLLALGENRSACTAYERYMMHLYHNPEGGLNLNEEDPPMPEKPPRIRYHRLLARAQRMLEKGQLKKADQLLAYAHHPVFPAEDPLRDLLEIELLIKTGFSEEAMVTVEGMMEQGKLSSSHALALIPLMYPEEGAVMVARLLLYASAVAITPSDVYDTVRESFRYRQPRLAASTARMVMEEHEQPYRLDCLYNLAVASLQAGELDTAKECAHTCWQVDPLDPNVDFLYRFLLDATRLKLDMEILQKLPLSLYGAAVTTGGRVCWERYRELLKEPEQAALELVKWSEQGRLMDAIAQMPDLHMDFLTCAEHMEPGERAAFLRQMLLFAAPAEAVAKRAEEMLRECGSTADVAQVRSGLLVIRPLEDSVNE